MQDFRSAIFSLVRTSSWLSFSMTVEINLNVNNSIMPLSLSPKNINWDANGNFSPVETNVHFCGNLYISVAKFLAKSCLCRCVLKGISKIFNNDNKCPYHAGRERAEPVYSIGAQCGRGTEGNWAHLLFLSRFSLDPFFHLAHFFQSAHFFTRPIFYSACFFTEPN